MDPTQFLLDNEGAVTIQKFRQFVGQSHPSKIEQIVNQFDLRIIGSRFLRFVSLADREKVSRKVSGSELMRMCDREGAFIFACCVRLGIKRDLAKDSSRICKETGKQINTRVNDSTVHLFDSELILAESDRCRAICETALPGDDSPEELYRRAAEIRLSRGDRPMAGETAIEDKRYEIQVVSTRGL